MNLFCNMSAMNSWFAGMMGKKEQKTTIKRFSPEYGKLFYHFYSSAEGELRVRQKRYMGYYAQQKHIKTGNCFKTEAEVLSIIAKIKELL